jgi:hypothetical protein
MKMKGVGRFPGRLVFGALSPGIQARAWAPMIRNAVLRVVTGTERHWLQCRSGASGIGVPKPELGNEKTVEMPVWHPSDTN